MKILILADSFREKHFPQHLRVLAYCLNRKGHHVLAAGMQSEPMASFPDRNKLSSHGVRTWAAGTPTWRIFSEPKRWWRLLRAAGANPPEIIHSYGFRSDFAAFMLKLRCPKTLWISGYPPSKPKNGVHAQKIATGSGLRFSIQGWISPVQVLGLYRKLQENPKTVSPLFRSQALVVKNYDPLTVEAFGREWEEFSQTSKYEQELKNIWECYFRIFPQKYLSSMAKGCDFGCGSGRWARLVAPRVGNLICVDASPRALRVARKNLRAFRNVDFECATLNENSVKEASLDFGYSLGVLHHLPSPAAGLQACVRKLKMGAPFLVYIYQSISTRPFLWRAIFHLTSFTRQMLCKLPEPWLLLFCKVIAALVYYPLARVSRAAELLGLPYQSIPLSFYRSLSFYTMKTDARDRFGTPLEHRFSKEAIVQMMKSAGLGRIRVSQDPPYWTVLGYRRA